MANALVDKKHVSNYEPLKIYFAGYEKRMSNDDFYIYNQFSFMGQTLRPKILFTMNISIWNCTFAIHTNTTKMQNKTVQLFALKC